MIEMAEVSVVIPTHRRPEMVVDAVRSTVRQTYTDIEVLVTYGGSQPQVAEALASIPDDRLCVIRRESPQPPAAARNVGLDAATGQYIVFLDDDDYLVENAIETLVETMDDQAPECAGIYPGRVERYSANKTEKTDLTERRVAQFKNVQTIGPSGTIFRKSALEKIEGFDESFPAYEDNDLLIRLLSEFHVLYLDRTLVVRRRDREDQLTNDFEAVTQGMELFLEKHAEALTPVIRATKLNILAEKYEQLNENQKARDTVQRIATLIEKPEISLTVTETGQLQKQLALWEARHNNPTAARQRLRRAIQFNPIDKATWFYYFWLHFGTFGYNLAEEFREHVYRPIAARFGD